MKDKGPSGSLSRRKFISGTAAAAASLAVAPQILVKNSEAFPKSDKLLKIGIIGGRFGTSFQWHEHPNCKVTAVCDIRPNPLQRLKKVYGCDIGYKNYRDLIADKNVDAVGVFTPAPLHVEMAVESMKAGKHVISAVPAGCNEQECVELLECVKQTGMIYMMAETSFYRREIITCRNWAAEKRFGEIISSESEYHHDGLEPLMFEEDGSPTWRHGYIPMHYPTHCTGMIVPVTGERLTEVTAFGWGDDHEILRTNAWNNPFWSETAMFKTSGGRSARVAVYWKVASGGTERVQFLGTEMSYYMPRPGGAPAAVARRESGSLTRNGYIESRIDMEPHTQENHWELLPEPLRHDSGHGGSHTFLTHEFVMAVLERRRPTVDIHEALAYTVPGFYAHKSALQGGTTMKIPDYGRG
ncbi:Gfo/Idh/MocA family protein [candidate division KSB1 bacterium]